MGGGGGAVISVISDLKQCVQERLGQNCSRRREDAPALEVIKVMFCSREDVLATRRTWRNSCGVTHKPPSPAPPLPQHSPTPPSPNPNPSPPPQLVADCGKSLAVTLLSLYPRRCEGEMVDDQFQMRALCGGRRHMVQHDLRTNTSTSPVPCLPPCLPAVHLQTEKQGLT